MASVFEAILGAVKTTIDGLGLTFGGAAVQVVVAKVFEVKDLRHQLPRVWVTPGREKAGPLWFGGPQGVAYTVEITAVFRSLEDQHLNLNVELDWHQMIRRLFDPPTLAGVPEVRDVRIEDGNSVDPAAFGAGHDVGVWTLLVRTAEA
jgi:hypothetical protein